MSLHQTVVKKRINIRSLVPFLVGGGIYTILYAWYSIRGRFQGSEVEYLFQSLGEQALTVAPLESLLNNHIQPPGLNFIYAVACSSPLGFDLSIQLLFFAAGIASVLLIASTLTNIGSGTLLTATITVIYAAIPSTILYSLWPYNTTLVAFFVAFALWGLSLHQKYPLVVAGVWGLAILGIFALRSSFVWPLAIAILLLPMLLSINKLKTLIVLTLFGVIPILGIQGYYFLKFDLSSTSSWAGQSLIKGYLNSGVLSKENLEQPAEGNLCLESLAQNPLFWDNISGFHDSCFDGATRVANKSLAISQEFKGDGTTIQHNNISRLVLSEHWNELAWRTTIANPTAIFQVALGVGSLESASELSLSPGFLYGAVEENLVSAMPVSSALRPLGAIFPIGAITLMFFALVAASSRSTRRLNDKLVFSGAVALFLANFVVTTTLEYGENNRFLVEVYPALAIGLGISIKYLWPRVLD